MEDRKKFLINLCYYAAVVAIIVGVFRYVVPWCLPFLLGFAIAWMLQGAIRKLSNKLNIKNKVIAIIVLALFYLSIGSLVVFGSIQLIAMLGDLFKELPAYYESSIEPALETLFESFSSLLSNINIDMAKNFKDLNSTLLEIGQQIAPSVSSGSISYLTDFVSFVPSFLVSFIFMIISSFFFAMDFTSIKDFIMLQFDDSKKNIIRRAKAHTVGTLGKFLKSYGIIMTITFIELSAGLLILGVDNAIAIALLIAIFDILPVLGTGGIMIPWIIISFINGQVELAFGLLVVYLIITVIRNIIEPKIVGVQVGAHPIVMLISMFLGVKILGAVGIIAFPVLVIIVKNLNEEGIIHLYKNSPKKVESTS